MAASEAIESVAGAIRASSGSMRKFFMGERTTGGKVGEANGCSRSVKMPHKLFT
jgi:hypothetical protein